MDHKMRRETQIGLACFAICSALRYGVFNNASDFMQGALVGCAIVALIIGCLPSKVYNLLKNWKMKILHRS